LGASIYWNCGKKKCGLKRACEKFYRRGGGKIGEIFLESLMIYTRGTAAEPRWRHGG